MLNIINHHWNIPFRFGSYLVYLQIWSCDFDHSTRWRVLPLLEEGPLSSKRARSRRQQCHCHCWIQLHRHLAQQGCSVKQVKNTNLIKFYQGIWLKNPKHSENKNIFHTIMPYSKHNPRCHTPVKSTPEVEVIKRYTNDWNAHVPWPCSATTCFIAVPYMDGFCIFV